MRQWRFFSAVLREPVSAPAVFRWTGNRECEFAWDAPFKRVERAVHFTCVRSRNTGMHPERAVRLCAGQTAPRGLSGKSAPRNCRTAHPPVGRGTQNSGDAGPLGGNFKRKLQSGQMPIRETVLPCRTNRGHCDKSSPDFRPVLALPSRSSVSNSGFGWVCPGYSGASVADLHRFPFLITISR